MHIHHAVLLLPLGLVVILRCFFGAESVGVKKVLILRCLLWIYQSGLVPESRNVYFLCLGVFLSFLSVSLFASAKDCPPSEDSGRLHHLQPLIFPSRTTHTRLFPKKHGFSYSYLLVGIPVGWKGSIASMVSADVDVFEDRQASESWFSVNAEDHLDRGQDKTGLIGKLCTYLESQGESIDNYPNAYLITAPRFLEYVFNPVSFWYLYSKDMLLQAMVLEVNNTFDERRMYFMKREASVDNGKSLDAADQKFTTAWKKDFHVSPFNSRKGAYSLVASNPFVGIDVRIDNSITLKSSKDHAKIVARIFSTGSAIDPLQMKTWTKICFVMSWSWVGFMTFPRIVKEAAKLFFKRKLHVWYRPEVMQTSIGRRPTQREVIIDRCFQQCLSYWSAVGQHHLSTSSGSCEPVIDHLRFKVLTPQFYTDIALADSPASYIFESSKLPEDRRTFYTSGADKTKALAYILTETNYNQTQEMDQIKKGVLHFLRWQVIHFLRRGRTHPLDIFVRNHVRPDSSEPYRKAVAALLLNQYICFGVVEILDLGWAALNMWLAWKGMGFFLNDVFTIGRGKWAPAWNTSSVRDAYVVWQLWSLIFS